MAWTVAVAAAAVAAGVVTVSIALIGLGLNSGLELLVAAVVIWQLRDTGNRQGRALSAITVTFLVGAAYLLAESIRELAGHSLSGRSRADVAVAAAALVVLPVLAFAKRRTGLALSNGVLLADAAESGTGGLAAAAALLGVGLDAWLGWWWAEPAAGLVIAVLVIAEAIEMWRHRH